MSVTAEVAHSMIYRSFPPNSKHGNKAFIRGGKLHRSGSFTVANKCSGSRRPRRYKRFDLLDITIDLWGFVASERAYLRGWQSPAPHDSTSNTTLTERPLVSQCPSFTEARLSWAIIPQLGHCFTKPLEGNFPAIYSHESFSSFYVPYPAQ